MKSEYPIYFHPSGCWEWLGDFNSNGYGWLYVPELGRRVVAHRYIYEREVGPIPKGFVLDHEKKRCKIGRACCNPAHMDPVPPIINTLRGNGPSANYARQIECKRGHPLPTERNSQGRRSCRVCRSERERLAREAKAATRSKRVVGELTGVK